MGVFFVVFVVALLWRINGLTFDSLWLDEGYQSIVDAYGQPLPDVLRVPQQPFILRFEHPAPPEEMLRNFRKVDPLTPPLYQLLLNRWIAVFGGSDLSVRSLSVCISMLAVSAVFWMCWALFGWRTALFTGLIQAFSPFDVQFGQEVRMYGLEELSAALSCGSLFLILLGSRHRVVLLALYAVSTWSMINSHYTSLFVVAYQIFISLSIVSARRNWRELGELIAGWFAAGLLWLPWFGMFRQAAAVRKASFYVARKATWWWPFYAVFVRIPLNWIVFLSSSTVVAYAIPLFATSATFLVVAIRQMFAPVATAPGARYRVKLSLLWSWAILPALGIVLIDTVENHKVVEVHRYLAATAPAIYMLAGVAIASLNFRKNWVRILVLLHFICAGVNNIAHAYFVHLREPWRDMANIVQTEVPGDELILVSEWYDVVPLDRYLQKPYKQVGVSHALGRERIAEILQGQSKFVLVTAQNEQIVGDIPPQYRMLSHRDLGHSLHIRFYSM